MSNVRLAVKPVVDTNPPSALGWPPTLFDKLLPAIDWLGDRHLLNQPITRREYEPSNSSSYIDSVGM